jgi:hypothetical protein
LTGSESILLGSCDETMKQTVGTTASDYTTKSVTMGYTSNGMTALQEDARQAETLGTAGSVQGIPTFDGTS